MMPYRALGAALLLLPLLAAAAVANQEGAATPATITTTDSTSISSGRAKSGSSSSSSGDGFSQQQQPLLIELPFWAAAQRSADVVLNFSTADAAAAAQENSSAIMFRGRPLQGVSHRKGFFHGNVAVVRFGGQLVVAVRKIRFHLTPRSSVAGYPMPPTPDQKWISFWTSRISLCTADAQTLQPLACSDFEPRTWTDCLWNGGFESLGPEDPRLIVWPSRGLFLMFISKPWPVNPGGTRPQDTQCEGPWAQQPWLVPLATYSASSTQGAAAAAGVGSSSSSSNSFSGSDPWTSSGIIRLQWLPPEWQGTRLAQRQRRHAAKGPAAGPLLHKQKNWAPFIHEDQLYFSQSFMPHVVIKPAPDGTCSLVATTDGAAFKALPARPRGNTQAVLVPTSLSGAPQPFFLGIIHTEVDRRYSNHLYMMQAAPPFAMLAVSAPLPLRVGPHPRVPAWTHISFPLSLQLLEDTGQLMIGYGSGDQASRVRFMPLAEALALFGGAANASSSLQQAAAAEGGGTDGSSNSGGGGDSSGSGTDGASSNRGAGGRGQTASAQAAAAAAVAAVEAVVGQRRRRLWGLFW